MKQRIAATYLALAALLALTTAPAASAQGETTAESQAPVEQEIGLLYAQTATRGSLERLKGSGGARYALTLRGVARQTVWFSDRPVRQAGHIPTSGFVGSWAGFGFAEDPPNAALTVLDAAAHEDTVVVTLGTPRYRRGTRMVRYPARIIEAPAGNLSQFESQRDEGVPRDFEDASLFIDDAVGQLIGDCWIAPFTKCPGADLSGANLAEAELMGAFLPDAKFTAANLRGANLSTAYLIRTDFVGADLTDALLRRSTIGDTDFSDADLSGADLTHAHWSSAEIDGARWCGTTMPDGRVNEGCSLPTPPD
jgi:hypothetical protein